MIQNQEAEGHLTQLKSGRWQLESTEFTSGSVFEILINNQWVKVRVEHDGVSYYLLPMSIRLIEGIPARLCQPH
jgi:hypothetical protein